MKMRPLLCDQRLQPVDLAAHRATSAAAKKAYQDRTTEFAAIVAACQKAGQGNQATALLASGRSLAEVEQVLKASATAASRDRAARNYTLTGHEKDSD
jgi:hypothetical protein